MPQTGQDKVWQCASVGLNSKAQGKQAWLAVPLALAQKLHRRIGQDTPARWMKDGCGEDVRFPTSYLLSGLLMASTKVTANCYFDVSCDP